MRFPGLLSGEGGAKDGKLTKASGVASFSATAAALKNREIDTVVADASRDVLWRHLALKGAAIDALHSVASLIRLRPPSQHDQVEMFFVVNISWYAAREDLIMNNPVYKAGAPIKIGCFAYNHYAIVSDRVIDDKPMLISLSYRTGTVAEEPWDEVVRGRKVTPSRLESSLAPEEIVRRARAAVGQRRYNLITSNCEQFVREMLGLKARSRQIEAAAGAGVSTLLLALRFARVHPAVTIAATAFGLVLGSRWSAR